MHVFKSNFSSYVTLAEIQLRCVQHLPLGPEATLCHCLRIMTGTKLSAFCILCQLTLSTTMSIPLHSFLVSTVLGRKLEWGWGVYWQKMKPKSLLGTQTSVQLHTTSSSSHTVSVGAELAMYAYCHSPLTNLRMPFPKTSLWRWHQNCQWLCAGVSNGTDPVRGLTSSRNQNTPLWFSPQTLCLPS